MDAWTVIANYPDRVGESPLWSGPEQALYWVDIEGRAVRRYRAGQGAQSWQLPERVGSIALISPGRLLAALESGIVQLRLDSGSAVVERRLADITHPANGMRFNDGRCDALGRFWVGTMAMDMSLAAACGGLYCLDERGLTGPHVSDLVTPNGLGFSPDSTVLYLSDSHPSVQKIWAFDFDLKSGALGARRLFVDMRSLSGRPDGAAVDNAGNYWICGNDGACVHCFSPQGQWLRSIAVPMPKPSMCAFGGADLSRLYVTSITPGPDTSGAPLSGAVIEVDPSARGLPEPRFTRFPEPALQH